MSEVTVTTNQQVSQYAPQSPIKSKTEIFVQPIDQQYYFTKEKDNCQFIDHDHEDFFEEFEQNDNIKNMITMMDCLDISTDTDSKRGSILNETDFENSIHEQKIMFTKLALTEE